MNYEPSTNPYVMPQTIENYLERRGVAQATWYYIMPKSGTNRHIKFGGHHPPPTTQIVPGTNRYIQF